MDKMKIVGKCITCGQEQVIYISREGFEKYKSGTSVQKALSDANAFEREFLISGMCFDCQTRCFGHPAPGKEADFGKFLGSCDCCGYPLYAKKIRVNDKSKCPQCHTAVS